MNPDDRLLAAYEALRRGRHAEVLELVASLETAELRRERPRLVAHALAWRAQARMAENNYEEARAAVLDAIRLAKQAGDADGLESLRALHGQIAASLAALETARLQEAADRALLERPWADLLKDGTPEEQASLLLRQAAALQGAGRAEEAVERASWVLQHVTGAREQVLAHLTLVRCQPQNAEAELQAAFLVAEAADDHNLIAAVAQAARVAQVRLPAPAFG